MPLQYNYILFRSSFSLAAAILLSFAACANVDGLKLIKNKRPSNSTFFKILKIKMTKIKKEKARKHIMKEWQYGKGFYGKI